MPATALYTVSNRWSLARSTNATDNGFPSKVPTATQPTQSFGAGAAQATAAAVYDLAGGGGGVAVQNSCIAKFFGVGSNNSTFSARLIGWRHLLDQGNNDTSVWDPTDLFEVVCTLTSTITGVAGKTPDNTNLFADTITITGTTANAGVNINVVSPANDRAGYLIVDFIGFRMIEWVFTTGGSATSCNALWALL